MINKVYKYAIEREQEEYREDTSVIQKGDRKDKERIREEYRKDTGKYIKGYRKDIERIHV